MVADVISRCTYTQRMPRIQSFWMLVKMMEIFIAQGRAIAEMISGWTYTLRMPGIQSFWLLIKGNWILDAQWRAVAEIISGWTYTQRMPGIQSFWKWLNSLFSGFENFDESSRNLCSQVLRVNLFLRVWEFEEKSEVGPNFDKIHFTPSVFGSPLDMDQI